MPKPWTAAVQSRGSRPCLRRACQSGDDNAARGSPGSAGGAAQGDRFAGHDAGHGVAGVDGVGVHHPRHDSLVGADVGSRGVAFRADEGEDLAGVATGDALEFLAGQRGGIDGDSALGAAIGDADDRAFPGHPHREGGDFVDVGVGVEADATFGGSAGQVVLHAVPVQDGGGAVVATKRHRDRQGTAGRGQGGAQAIVEPE